jgi:hypothetical protein
MEWLARNPDLNSTQHLWDNMEKRLRATEGHPNHFSQLTHYSKISLHHGLQNIIVEKFNVTQTFLFFQASF